MNSACPEYDIVKGSIKEEDKQMDKQVVVARTWEDLDRILPKKPKNAKEYLATKLEPVAQGEYEMLFNGDQTQLSWGK